MRPSVYCIVGPDQEIYSYGASGRGAFEEFAVDHPSLVCRTAEGAPYLSNGAIKKGFRIHEIKIKGIYGHGRPWTVEAWDRIEDCVLNMRGLSPGIVRELILHFLEFGVGCECTDVHGVCSICLDLKACAGDLR